MSVDFVKNVNGFVLIWSVLDFSIFLKISSFYINVFFTLSGPEKHVSVYGDYKVAEVFTSSKSGD